MWRRYRYSLDIPNTLPPYAPNSVYGRPAIDDLDALAELMLDAYAGAIDYDGESWVPAGGCLDYRGQRAL